jgi:anti-anti-sigma factor
VEASPLVHVHLCSRVAAVIGRSASVEVCDLVEPLVVDSYDFHGGRVIAPRGELDAYTRQGFAQHLSGPPGTLIVVDLVDLTYLDSSGLGALNEARRKAIEDGGSLVVCNPGPWVRRVFEITGLDTWITDWDPAWSNGSIMRSAP